MHINHRQSFDLDLYSREKFDLQQTQQRFETEIPSFKLISTSWQTIIGISAGTEISIFYYQYDLLEHTTEFSRIQVASVSDIAAMKIEAICGRGLKRNFFDLYTISKKENISLKEIIDLNQKKYNRSGSNLSHILKSLTYFDDAEKYSERADTIEPQWDTVKTFFMKETTEILSSLR